MVSDWRSDYPDALKNGASIGVRRYLSIHGPFAGKTPPTPYAVVLEVLRVYGAVLTPALASAGRCSRYCWINTICASTAPRLLRTRLILFPAGAMRCPREQAIMITGTMPWDRVIVAATAGGNQSSILGIWIASFAYVKVSRKSAAQVEPRSQLAHRWANCTMRSLR